MSAPAAHEEARQAIAALERLLAEHPENIERDIIAATRAVVALRNRLTAITRESGGDAETPRLEHANAALSILMAGHYPIEGMRWDCVKQARDSLVELTPAVSEPSTETSAS